ncbi:hypothetical protein AWE51_24710 [Aquimarina aggregata]|uniref:PDZ domain-containing protein n=1 Tax=Aquimarina aggregata TaxID=1642818 RepID=A0A162DIG5_9FLAO|nr:alpha/beta hydrolase [Aquimarina aggregata]KZS40878.1 hypothetical protein AWE51_24710 [Aquimarina aggregata]
MKKTLITLLIFCGVIPQCLSQALKRRASFEAKILWPDNKTPGAKIDEIDEKSPLFEAGFKQGDIIVSVNDRSIVSGEDWSAATYRIRAYEETTIVVKRRTNKISKTLVLNPLPKEQNSNVDTFYESVTNDYGITQRVIITRPKGNGPFPAIFLIQGLSCSTIEKYSGRSNNWVRLIKDIAEKSNMVLVRVDKPGVGDSEGDCGKTDFKTEINGYEAAMRLLKSKSYINTNKIIVYGNSMGSALAPYFANKFNAAGIISDGTFFKSWYEHMLEIERRILEIEGKSQTEIYHLMNTVYIPIYYEMLIKKKSYAHIIKENPLFQKYHRHQPYHMYGRSVEYYHQVQDFNFAAEWERVKVPVRIRWGTNDWIMTENDNDMIIHLLEKSNHTDYQLYKYPKLDHWSTIHPDYSSSFNFKPGQWEDKISQQIIDWAWEIVR